MAVAAPASTCALPPTHLLGGCSELEISHAAEGSPDPSVASDWNAAGRCMGDALGQAHGLTGAQWEKAGCQGGGARSQQQKPPPGTLVSGLSKEWSSSRPFSLSIADGKE